MIRLFLLSGIQSINARFFRRFLVCFMSDFGFHRIVGRSNFYKNCKSGAASEWWHMQSHNKTYQGKTTWEETLASVHNDTKLRCSPVYKHRKRVFRGKGFTGKSKDVPWGPC